MNGTQICMCRLCGIFLTFVSTIIEMAVFPSKMLVFVLGFAFGVFLAFLTTVSRHKLRVLKSSYSSNRINDDISYEYWLAKLGYKLRTINFDEFNFGNKSSRLLESYFLKSRISVLCVMFVQDTNKAYLAMNTWMKHCNTIKFYSTKPAMYLDATVLRPKSSWHYLCDVIRHINDTYNDYNWVLFVPDDIFAIPENLRRYVFNLNFETPYYLGHSATFWNEQYNLAQAGYVLSKGSIQHLSNKFPSSKSCQNSGKHWKNGDFFLGK